MKKSTKIISGVLSIGFLITTGITTFAGSDTNLSNTFISEENTNKGFMRGSRGCFGNIERQEITEEESVEIEENMKERLSEELNEGYITQQYYDQAISDIEEGNRPMYFGRGHSGFDNIEKSELTEEEKSEMEEYMKERLSQQLNEGYITQEYYDQAISDIEEGNRPMYFGRGHGSFDNMKRSELTEEQKADNEEGKRSMYFGRGHGSFCNIEITDFNGNNK